MTDPLDALREPIRPVDPDPVFAAGLRARLERAVLDPAARPLTAEEDEMTPATTATTSTATATAAERATALPLHTVTPYLAVVDARAAVEFYLRAFGARRRDDPIVMPDGRVGHVEVALGDSVLMLADEYPELGLAAPVTRGGASQSLRLEVTDPDAVVARAAALGAEVERPVADSPYGRGGVVRDPSGHRWMVSAAPPRVRPGEVVYASLWTRDAAAAERFFGAVLGTVPPVHGGHDRPTLMACFAVADLDEAVALVRAAGGTARDPRDEPYGRVADCVDDQGLSFALRAGSPEVRPEAAGAAHLVLHVPDAVRARAFYGTALPWRFAPGGVPDGWTVQLASGDPRPRTSLWGGRRPAAAVPVFAVPDLAAAVAAVRAAGGTSTEPQRRRFGLVAEALDGQDLRFQLVQAS
ncbi:MAG TPA: VOC family protein [Pseudonocardia sp.]|nr:VOC family protein [Pseudonocardia sp.]